MTFLAERRITSDNLPYNDLVDATLGRERPASYEPAAPKHDLHYRMLLDKHPQNNLRGERDAEVLYEIMHNRDDFIQHTAESLLVLTAKRLSREAMLNRLHTLLFKLQKKFDFSPRHLYGEILSKCGELAAKKS